MHKAQLIATFGPYSATAASVYVKLLAEYYDTAHIIICRRTGTVAIERTFKTKKKAVLFVKTHIHDFWSMCCNSCVEIVNDIEFEMSTFVVDNLGLKTSIA